MNLRQVTLIASDLDRSRVLHAINLLIAAVSALLVWSALRSAAFCPFFIMLVVT